MPESEVDLDLLALCRRWVEVCQEEQALREQIETATGKSPEDFLAAMRRLLGT